MSEISPKLVLQKIKADMTKIAIKSDKIKNDAFLRGIPLIEYLRMLGILARDRYFSEHGMNIRDIDVNDPTKN